MSHRLCLNPDCSWRLGPGANSYGSRALTRFGNVSGMPPVTGKSTSKPILLKTSSTGAASALYTCSKKDIFSTLGFKILTIFTLASKPFIPDIEGQDL